MKKASLEETIHGSTSDMVMGVIESVPYIRVVSKLDEALEKRGLTQQQLASITGLRPATISDLVNGYKSSLTKVQLMAVMIALRITDIREVFDIEFDEKTFKQFTKESEEWVSTKAVPKGVVKLYEKNAKALFNPNSAVK